MGRDLADMSSREIAVIITKAIPEITDRKLLKKLSILVSKLIVASWQQGIGHGDRIPGM